jgi:hypothetical protein
VRVRLVCLGHCTLPHPDGLRARARGGRGAGTGATLGATGTPKGAKRRRRLHLRGPGRRLRRAACVRGHRRVAGLRDGTDRRGERGARAGRNLLPCHPIARARSDAHPGSHSDVRKGRGGGGVADDGAGTDEPARTPSFASSGRRCWSSIPTPKAGRCSTNAG